MDDDFDIDPDPIASLLLDNSMGACLILFSESNAVDKFAFCLKPWTDINPPPLFIRTYYIQFGSSIPNPYGMVLSFLENNLLEFRHWFLRFLTTYQSDTRVKGAAEIKIGNSRSMLICVPVVQCILMFVFKEEQNQNPNYVFDIHVVITRQMVENLDIPEARKRFASYHARLGDRCRNKVTFTVSGYERDDRELYDIPEVRIFFQILFDEEPGLFYWLNVNTSFPLLYYLNYQPIRRSKNLLEFRNDDLTAFFVRGQRKLTAFCAELGHSSAATMEEIGRFNGYDFAPDPISENREFLNHSLGCCQLFSAWAKGLL